MEYNRYRTGETKLYDGRKDTKVFETPDWRVYIEFMSCLLLLSKSLLTFDPELARVAVKGEGTKATYNPGTTHYSHGSLCFLASFPSASNFRAFTCLQYPGILQNSTL